MQRVRSRGPEIAPREPEAAPSSERFDNGDTMTHTFSQHNQVRALLARPDLVQPSIAAIRTICDHFGADPSPVEEFFRQSPVFQEGDAHRRARKHFAIYIQATAKRLKPRLNALADQHFRQLTERPGGDLAQHGAIEFVDEIFGLVFEQHLAQGREPYTAIAHHPQSIFEIAHHPKRLLATVEAIRPFIGPDASHGLQPTEAATLLGFALMGRDPLIGTLTDFLRILKPMSPQARSARLEATTVHDIFRDTSAVNYVTRVATQPFAIGSTTIQPNDLVVCMLMNARPSPDQPRAGNLAFGHGHHKCAGQALSMAIGQAFLEGLRRHQDTIPWTSLNEREPEASVFRRYRSIQ